MDSTQRFTEDNDYIGYEVDFWVMDILQSLSSDVAKNPDPSIPGGASTIVNSLIMPLLFSVICFIPNLRHPF